MSYDILGCVIGGAYADAIGKSTEFMTKYQINKIYNGLAIKLGVVFDDEHRNTWDPYDWTDDTDQSILVFRSIKENARNPDLLFAEKLYDWYLNGFPELGDVSGCGIGMPMRWVITYEKFVESPFNASYNVWKNTDGVLCEDGAIMRSWIIGTFNFDKNTLIHLATKICQITHYDPRCVASCIFVTLCVNKFIYHSKNINDVIDEATKEGINFIKSADYITDDLEYTRDQYVQKFIKYINRGNCESLENIPLNRSHSRSSTKNPLACAVYAMKNMALGYDKIIQHIIYQGGDADTNACVAGAIIGAYGGIKTIPEDFINLKNIDWLKSQILY